MTPRASPPASCAARSAASRRCGRGGRRLEGGRHRRPDLRAGHHVRLHGEAVADQMAGMVDAHLPVVAPPCRRRPPPRPGGGPYRIAGPGAGQRLGAVAAASLKKRHRRPYERSAKAWVATAPTPARAHGTIEPTANMHVCTATPRAPVAGSRATMEYVIAHLRPIGRRCGHWRRTLLQGHHDRSECLDPAGRPNICSLLSCT
jgi:hypothetical protein